MKSEREGEEKEKKQQSSSKNSTHPSPAALAVNDVRVNGDGDERTAHAQLLDFFFFPLCA